MREKSLVCLLQLSLPLLFLTRLQQVTIDFGVLRLASFDLISAGLFVFSFPAPISPSAPSPYLITTLILTIPPYKRKDKIIKTKIFLSNGLITKEITVLLTIVSYNLFLCFGAELSCETPIFKSPVKEISLSVVIFNDPYHEEISFILFK